jgi:hypothetical protein
VRCDLADLDLADVEVQGFAGHSEKGVRRIG